MRDQILHTQLLRRATHELTGPSADIVAVSVAVVWGGRVAVIGLEGDVSTLDPHGLPGPFSLQSLLLTAARNRQDVLWSLETALRSGAVSTAIAHVGRGLDLTESRRVQLAAEAGGATALIITPSPLGSTASETRWRTRPVPVKRFDSPKLHLECYRNKRGTSGAFIGTLDRQTGHIHLVSAPATRSGEA